MNEAVAVVVGAVLSAVGILAAAILTSRQSRRATDQQVDLDERRLRVDERQRLVDNLARDNDWVRKQLEDVRRHAEEQDRALRDLQDQLHSGTERLRRLEQLQQDTERRYRAAIRYIRGLLLWAAQIAPLLPAGAPAMPAPAEDLQTWLDDQPRRT